jgi:hypothetical protein
VESKRKKKRNGENAVPFLWKHLQKAEFKGKLSVVEARKEANELSQSILPE